MTLTTSGSPVSVVTLKAGQTITITITLTYKIDDADTIRSFPHFCAAGTSLLIYKNGNAIDMTGISINPATMIATFTLPLNTFANIDVTDVFTFKAKDPRDATSTFV